MGHDMSQTTYHIIRGTIILAALVAFAGWMMIRWLKRSRDDPGVLILKWFITIPVVALAYFSVSLFGPAGPFVIVFCGVIISIMWTPNLGSWMIKPLTNAIDGGMEPPEPKPFYSIARALRGKGKYDEAAAKVREQLEHFPNDCEGVMLLAAIQAEDLNDLRSAELTLRQFCDGPNRPPRQVAAAFNQLADWHIRFPRDCEAARQSMAEIVRRFPDTELAVIAAQRVAHIGDTQALFASRDGKKFEVTEGIQYVGLEKEPTPGGSGADPATLAAQYVKRLEEHPLDTEAREHLAKIYAEHFHRLDLATAQLDQLVDCPNQPGKKIVHWLNLLADLQIQHGSNLEAARATLQRIIEKFPNSAAAESARRRLDYLKLGLKAKNESQGVKLGSYDQYVGLKSGPNGPT